MNRGRNDPPVDADDFFPDDPSAARSRHNANLSEQIKAALSGRRQ